MTTKLKEVDVVIVGLGWTGGILAKELTEAGMKVVALERGAPRSSATTFMPASVSSLARMPPVQPSPTTTTSTSLSFVVMTRPSTHVRDAERLVRERLAAIFLDVIAMHGDDAGKADDRPSGLVAVAAIDRIGIHALDHGLVKRGPEHPHRQPVVESDLAGGQTSQH